MIEDFQHVCITCRDIERSIRFYESLGLEAQHPEPVSQEAIARTFNLPSAQIKVVHLVVPGSPSTMFIDLVQWLDPEPTGDSYPALTNIGINRLALRVSDIDEATASLRHKGFSFLSDGPQTFAEGLRSIVTTDPDGVFIQLLEIR